MTPFAAANHEIVNNEITFEKYLFIIYVNGMLIVKSIPSKNLSKTVLIYSLILFHIYF